MTARTAVLIGLLLATPAFAHDPLEVGGAGIHILLDSKATGGSFGMFLVTQPGADGPPRHIHADADEAFFVVEGEFEVLAGEKTAIIGEGQAGFAPKGSVHTFRSTSEDGGKILVIVAPGGFEGFFRKVVAEGVTPESDLERFLAISEEFQQQMAGPPLGRE